MGDDLVCWVEDFYNLFSIASCGSSEDDDFVMDAHLLKELSGIRAEEKFTKTTVILSDRQII